MALFSLFQKNQQKAGNLASQKLNRSYAARASGTPMRPHHGYHLVDPSPWPALTRFCLLWLTTSQVLFFHQYAGAATLLTGALCALVYCASIWWRDVNREGVLGFHTRKVKNGQHLGMQQFIVSEAAFFVGLLWAALHCALMPTIQVGMSWPPVGIVPVNWTALPFANTLILQRSYFTCNAALHAMHNNEKQKTSLFLGVTVFQGVVFLFGQYLEYTEAAFTFSDSAFGSTFYQTTGFHGFHVLVGRLYLVVCMFQVKSSSAHQNVALELAALYWHFVDIVWVFVLILVYIWGGAQPAPELSACHDRTCVLQQVLHDARAYASAHDTALFDSLSVSNLLIHLFFQFSFLFHYF